MNKIISILFVSAFLLLNAGDVSAYEIQDIKDTPIKGDFVLGHGKTELSLDPGEKTMRSMMVTNRTGEERVFTVTIEDFTGSDNPEETVVLLGGEKGPYSLRDYLKPEIMEFTLAHGQRMILSIEISIPENIKAGGLYGTVLVSTSPVEKKDEDNTGKTKLVSRIGNLFFIKINGEVIENGFLESFNTIGSKRMYYDKETASFELFVRNEGTVHILPYGKIKIENLLGKKIGEVAVDTFFALPDSLRKREVKWDKTGLFGRYKAIIELNRNYQTQDDVVDEMSIYFWVIPWKIILISLSVIFLVIIFSRWILRKFKFEIKKKE